MFAFRRGMRFQTRLTLILVVLSFLVVFLGSAVFYDLAEQSLMQELGEKLTALAGTVAAGLDVAAHEGLRKSEDTDTPTYARLQQQLDAIRRANRASRVADIYTMRAEGANIVFVLCSYPPGSTWTDFGPTSDAPTPRVDEVYPEPTKEMRAALERGEPVAETEPYHDEWGAWISGYAPLRDARGQVVGIVGVDAAADTVAALKWNLGQRALVALGLGIVLSLILGALVSRHATRPLEALTAGVNAIGRGDFEARVHLRTGDELQTLGEAFNNMARGLHEREQLKGALVRHLSRQVAERILRNPDLVQLGGEKVEATILFADIRNFTQHAETMSPEQVVGTLNEYLGALVEVILDYEGTLDKFLGDGVMAVFGAPLPQPDHAERAVRCALAMQQAVEDLNHRRAERGLLTLGLGIGVNSGEVVAGQIGSQERLEYTVVGREVNRAFRIQGVAGPGEVVLSGKSCEGWRELFPLQDLGPVALRGFAEAVPLCRVVR